MLFKFQPFCKRLKRRALILIVLAVFGNQGGRDWQNNHVDTLWHELDKVAMHDALRIQAVSIC